MASNKLNVSDFDFDAVKANLKTFLQSQSEFQDYNFEGSGFAVLLDTLAYNTHYLGFNANMLANEMYLDSADIRKNIVSLAKMLGYTPTSVRTSKANVDITVNDATGSSVTMAKGTVFTTAVDGVSYQFITNSSATTSPENGIYKFSNVTLFEGTAVSYRYTADANDPDQKFIIPTDFADTSTLVVKVQNSANDTTTSTYILASGLSEIQSTTRAYFLQEGDEGRFEVYFGDGIVGRAIQDGNIVILEYIVSNVDAANGASIFTAQTNVGGFTNITVTTNSISQGGTPAQSKESIRVNAPLSYSAQNRAVTTSDYETLVQSLYPNAQSVSAWGGEDDETPVYGVVKIAIKAVSGSTLTEATKASIVTQLKKYNVASVRPEIVEPETTKVLLTSIVKYDEKSTTKTSDTLKANIVDTLTDYNTNTLQKFDGIFRYSKVTGLIDDTDTSIISNITTLKIRKTFTPTLNSSTRYDVYFRNAIYNPHEGHRSAEGGILESSGFKVTDDTTNVYFLDDDGLGNIRRYFLTGSVRNYENNTQGTINYSTGQITINSLSISLVENIRGSSSSVIELTVQPNSNDIIPVRDQIIEIDIPNSVITVEADTFVGGSADAGVGYTASSSYGT
jgi:hypothetical protein